MREATICEPNNPEEDNHVRSVFFRVCGHCPRPPWAGSICCLFCRVYQVVSLLVLIRWFVIAQQISRYLGGVLSPTSRQILSCCLNNFTYDINVYDFFLFLSRQSENVSLLSYSQTDSIFEIRERVLKFFYNICVFSTFAVWLVGLYMLLDVVFHGRVRNIC